MEIYRGHRLTAFMLSVGDDPVAFEAIPRLRRSLPSHEMVVWNQGSGEEFGRRLEAMSDVYISGSHNFGTSKGFGFALMYLEYDWLIISAPDILVRDEWFKYVVPEMVEGVGVIGDYMGSGWELGRAEDADKDCLPDGITLWSRKMVEDVGGISPAFGIWGHDLLDLQIRAIRKGWKIKRVATGLTHYGDGHTGVQSVKSKIGEKAFDELHSRSCRALNDKRTNWWQRYADKD